MTKTIDKEDNLKKRIKEIEKSIEAGLREFTRISIRYKQQDKIEWDGTYTLPKIIVYSALRALSKDLATTDQMEKEIKKITKYILNSF